jgi:hypothetical protein
MFGRTRTAVIFSIAAAIGWAGCSGNEAPNAPGSDLEQTSLNLEEEFGGYGTSDELPAFGDASLRDYADLEVDANDPIADDPLVRNLRGNERVRTYAWTILWGDLGTGLGGGDGNSNSVIDWTGSITADNGAVVLLRTIDFEQNDQIVPRTDRASLEWVSTTGEGHDGIRVLIYDNPNDNTDPVEAVSFNSGGYSRTFTMDELADLDLTVDVEGGQIHFLSTEVSLAAPIRGFVNGRWNWVPGESMGHFSGVWVGPHGRPSGWVRGHYGENVHGQEVFFGKYIDWDGNFKGLLRGRVEVDRGELNAGAGRFVGRWTNEDMGAEGSLHGRWNVTRNRGFFDGRWCDGCP